MLDALTNRTRVTTATPLRGVQHDAEVGRELRSAAEPFPLWSSASCAINILPLKTKIKQRVPGSPSRNCPFELEITFCVRGVFTALLGKILAMIASLRHLLRFACEFGMGLRPTHRDESALLRSIDSKKGLPATIDGVRSVPGK